jgi:hypothetical protein
MGFASCYPERAKLSAHLAQVGATERTNCNSLTAFGRFPDARNCTEHTCVGVRHLWQLRKRKTAVANVVVSRRQSDHTNGIRSAG